MRFQKLKIAILLLLSVVTLQAQDYPFVLPANITATYDIDTKSAQTFNNNLLGLNIDWHAGYESKGYNHPDAKSFMRNYKPVSVRFPQGVWSNFYDWKLDARRRYDDYDNKEFVNPVENFQHIRYGFPGFTELHSELGFDVMWTWNMNYDSNQKSVERLRDHVSKGFKVQDIELGNELFWGTQKSHRVSTPEKFYAVAKSLSDTLKKIDPTIKISIPVSWRRGKNIDKFDHTHYNQVMTADSSYFDAISVHRYVHLDRGKDTVSQDAYKGILTARLDYVDDVNYCRSLAPGKPVWLTEWGVSCGYRAASYLGMADSYLYIFENPDIYTRTCWFQINGYDAFFKTEIKDNKKVITKRGFGSVYEIIRSVFQDSKLLNGKMATTQLLPGANAVTAGAVLKDGKFQAFVVNLSNQSVPFSLKLDGKKYNKSLKHKAMNFNCLGEDRIIALEENPLKLVKTKKNEIILAPYSVNIISENKF